MDAWSTGTRRALVLIVALWLIPAAASAQEPPATPPAVVAAPVVDQAPAPTRPAPASIPGYAPITPRERLNWAVRSTVGPAAWASGLLSATWYTGWNSPPEWGTGLRGVGKRLGDHQATAGISNGLEAGLGALWGEDPRYPRSADRRVRSRVASIFKDLFYAPYADGRRRFAYARLAAAFGNNAIDDLWLPPSSRDWGSTIRRTGYAYLAHLAVDAFEEFWPDLRVWLGRKLDRKPPAVNDPARESRLNSQKTRDLSTERTVAVLDRSVTVW